MDKQSNPKKISKKTTSDMSDNIVDSISKDMSEANDLNTKYNIKNPISRNVFQPNSKYFTIMLYALLFVFCSLLLFKLVANYESSMEAIGSIIGMLSPFLGGTLIALILYPGVHRIYQNIFIKRLKLKSKKLAKWLSILLVYLIAFGIIAILIVVIVPQIYNSLGELTEQLPAWYDNTIAFFKEFRETHPSWIFFNLEKLNAQFESVIPQVINYVTGIMSSLVPLILNTSMAIVKGLINILIAVMVSVYMISDHNNIFYQFKRLLYALMPRSTADSTRVIIKNSAQIFLGFIGGKAIDSLIIGIITFILMVIFKFPYAVLISVIVGITNMIPYFGPYIGGVIGAVIIVIVNPIQVIFFAILILAIQQFDGLFLGPKILGDKVGLKPLWVIFAIVAGGHFFGVLGMFLGVPAVAVFAYIIDIIVSHFLRKRDIEVEPYDHPDEM